MYVLRRWWDQNAVKLGIAVLVLGGAIVLRQTNAVFVAELYQALSRPFQGEPPAESELQTDYTRQLEQRIVELESQKIQLQELLDYVETTPNQEGITAPVIGRSADHWWQQVALGRGENDGIQVGDVVLGAGGLIGRVTHTTANTSRVLLISDPTSQVGVTVSRSRSMGFIRGQSEDRAVMEFFDKVPDVQPGDVVVTSTYSQRFPAGIPIGQVESVNLNSSPVPEAVVELSAPLNSVEWVTVIPGIPDTGLQDSPFPTLELNPEAESEVLPGEEPNLNPSSGDPDSE